MLAVKPMDALAGGSGYGANSQGLGREAIEESSLSGRPDGGGETAYQRTNSTPPAVYTTRP